ncbi:ROK family transcriptional regulator [Mycolicibacterium sp. CBMA 226]|uniref:ROK family transcriptional regulator n=1 Tax=Mycolicibacterium sp. CBMA 226 TaxID=2606611 RepID=UPI0012DFD820|nr:ROK family transcriptional regulator [Mycolicibacterium sp. CBMA 226]MUL78281.1 ROK family transcriptional regulator [Mycolicibacterium sp. CBMA 226]
MALSGTLVSPTPGEVFAVIRAHRAITRSEIGRITGLSRTAVTARVAALAADDLVIEREEAASTGGRPATQLTFNVAAGIVFAVAIGRSRTQLALCNLAGDILATADIDQEPGMGPDDLMPDLVKRVESLLDDSGHRGDRVFGIGLSLPGTVDQQRGASLDSPNMSGWDGVPLAPYFRRLTDAPMVIDNDANVIALAERRFGFPDAQDMLVVKASTGLGAGIVMGGQLRRGAVQAAGDFGHSKIAAAAGISCRCGDTGCVEAVAGGWAIVRDLRRDGYAVGHLRDVVTLAQSGDAKARSMIRDSGRHVGEVLAAAVNLINPAVLVVAGDMVGAYDVFVAGLRETLYGNASTLATRTLQIVPSVLQERVGIVGCATTVLDHILSPDMIDAALQTRLQQSDS